ncbi:MAG: CHAT domain-containing protein, partial [Armatimonadetes bacterium]|nr:CHAT domain-containing protein [Armatimonadota bacterium]
MAATLTVMRLGAETAVRRFFLQTQKSPAVLTADKHIGPEDAENIRALLVDYARCFAGYEVDGPSFALTCQVLWELLVPDPLKALLKELDETLTIMTDDPTLPWEVLHDGQDHLALRRAVARQMPVQRQMAPLLRVPLGEGDAAALVIADPRCDLPSARQQGDAIAELLTRHGTLCEILPGSDATFQMVTESLLRPRSVIHYCGHAHYDDDRGTSVLCLHDRELPADALAGLFKGHPLVFLNACYSDSQGTSPSERTPGGAYRRVQSLAQAFLIGNGGGAADAVVASMWEIPEGGERAAPSLAVSFYQALLEHQPVGEALRRCRCEAREQGQGPMVWAPYVVYADPSFVPFGVPEPATREAAVPPPPEPPRRDVARPRSLQDVLQGAAPLDDSARRVFHEALRHMEGLEQRLLTSIHLLVG